MSLRCTYGAYIAEIQEDDNMIGRTYELRVSGSGIVDFGLWFPSEKAAKRHFKNEYTDGKTRLNWLKGYSNQ